MGTSAGLPGPEQVSRLRKGMPIRIKDVPVQETGTVGLNRRRVFPIGSTGAGGPYVSVVGDRIAPSALRRQEREMGECNELPATSTDAYDEARMSREAFDHRQSMRAVDEAIVPDDRAASSARPKKTAPDGTLTSSPLQSKSSTSSVPADAVDKTPEQKVARLEARVDELEVETTKLTTEREILQRAAKYFAGETRW